MLARLYMCVILSLSLLGGAFAAAPAMGADQHVVTAVTAAVSGAGVLHMAGGAKLDAGDANDTPPLLAEMTPAQAPLQWGAAWKPARSTAVVDTLLFQPDKPPRRIA